MQLKKLLLNKPYCNELHFFVIFIVLILLTLKYLFFAIFLVIYLIFIIRKTKLLIPTIIIVFIFSLTFIIRINLINEQPEKIVEEEFEVIDRTNSSVIIKSSYKLICYDSDYVLEVGDVIKAKVRIVKFAKPSYKGDFNYRNYYFAKGIYNRGTILKYEKINHNNTIASFRFKAINYYENKLGKSASAYIKALIFGYSDFDEKIQDAYSTLFISHILIISGMHILIIFKFLKLLFQKTFKLEGTIISSLILGIYVIFLGFPISALRAYLFLILRLMNDRGRIKYTKLDIFSLSFLIMVLFDPFSSFQTSFILSFLVSFILIFKSEFIHTKSLILNDFLTSLLCIFTTLPIIVNQTNELNVLGMIVAFILTTFMTYFILPITFINLILPSNFQSFFYQIFELFIIYISKCVPSFKIPYLNIYLIIIYYFLFVLLLVAILKRRKIIKYLGLFLGLIIICINLRSINSFYKITIIDVGQGDSILIELPFDRGNILIDSYGDNVKYLKCIGLKRLNYLILTHFDNDHIGSSTKVINEIKVDEIIFSYYEDVNKISNLKVNRKTPVRAGDTINIENLKLEVLSPLIDLNDSNSNSLVIKMKIKNYSFLFMGDATKESEKELIESYGNILDADVLKVGHHGSNTSSSSNFLNYVTPNISIISVGENNSYGLPNYEVVERLKTYGSVYMTKTNGNINIIISDKLTIKVYR